MTMHKPSREKLQNALAAAGTAHHDFETNVLKGEPDEHWPGWYAAYVLGRVGDFVTPTVLAGWLAEAPASVDWPASTAAFIKEQLGAD